MGAHDTGSLSAGERIARLEEVHAQGGACEEKRSELWQQIDRLNSVAAALSERLTRLEVKILAVLIVGQVVVTFAVQLGLAIWKGKGG